VIGADLPGIIVGDIVQVGLELEEGPAWIQHVPEDARPNDVTADAYDVAIGVTLEISSGSAADTIDVVELEGIVVQVGDLCWYTLHVDPSRGGRQGRARLSGPGGLPLASNARSTTE
jgi:hypothetical protein